MPRADIAERYFNFLSHRYISFLRNDKTGILLIILKNTHLVLENGAKLYLTPMVLLSR